VLPSLPEFGAGERGVGFWIGRAVSGLKPGDQTLSRYKVCTHLFAHGITTRRPCIDPFLGS
jgi:hypothetical protein